MQLRLRLSREERKKIRATLYEYFAAYRACKVLLDRDMVPHPPKPKPKRGYAHAIDPDLIRVPRVFPGGPASPAFTASPILTSEEQRWQAFVDWIDRAVRRLPPYQRRIIRLRFLGREPLPTDDEVHERLRAEKWYVSKRYYEEQKAAALLTLSIALKVKLDADSQT